MSSWTASEEPGVAALTLYPVTISVSLDSTEAWMLFTEEGSWILGKCYPIPKADIVWKSER